MRRLCCLALASSIGSIGSLGTAVAKRAPATSGDSDDGEPRPTLVQGKLDGNTASFTVQYRLHTSEPTDGKNLFVLSVPGVVIHADATADGATHPLALAASDKATAAFQAVHDREANRVARGPRRSAVLVEGSAGSVSVSMLAGHRGPVALELQVELPTCFYRDVRYVGVPQSWEPVLAPALRTLYAKPSAIAEACPTLDSSVAWVGFPSVELAHTSVTVDRIGAQGGRIELGSDHVARVEIDVAGMLAETPRDLVTAILVDGSRSLTTGELASQRAVVAAYLRKSPRARVQVIAYARRAKALLPGWSTSATAAAELDDALANLVPTNGSNVDAGLIEAGNWLAKISGTRRVVILTDERLAHALETAPPASLTKLVPAGTLIHVVALDDGETVPERDDYATLGPLAAATEGMAIRSGAPDGVLDLTLLLHPLTLDHLQLTAPGWTAILASEMSCAATLAAGRSCTWWGQGDATTGPITMEADVWGQHIVRVIHPELARATALARELSTNQTLEVKLHDRAALAARAVNAKWSLYAEWGGPNGYADVQEGGTSGCGCGGSSSSTTASHTFGFTRVAPQPKPPLNLLPQLAGAVAKCNLGQATVEADIENTNNEIVAVDVTVHAPQPVDERALHHCVEEAIWGAALTVPIQYPHETTHVTF